MVNFCGKPHILIIKYKILMRMSMIFRHIFYKLNFLIRQAIEFIDFAVYFRLFFACVGCYFAQFSN